MPDTTPDTAAATSGLPKTIVIRCPSCGTMSRVDLARLSAGPKCAKCRNPLPLGHPFPVTDGDFPKYIAGAGVPVLVDFYADWCGPCHMMAPTLDEFATRRASDVLVLKLDTDANPNTAAQFGIRGIPTLIVFQNGKEARRHVGVATRQVLDALVS